jgi:hypothetical protein
MFEDERMIPTGDFFWSAHNDNALKSKDTEQKVILLVSKAMDDMKNVLTKE